MKLAGLFKVSLITSALVLAGCGGDVNITPTTNDNRVDNSQDVVSPGTGDKVDNGDKEIGRAHV